MHFAIQFPHLPSNLGAGKLIYFFVEATALLVDFDSIFSFCLHPSKNSQGLLMLTTDNSRLLHFVSVKTK